MCIRDRKLPLVDKDFNLKGLITIKDIEKTIKYPLAAKDDQGRLLCGAGAVSYTHLDVYKRQEPGPIPTLTASAPASISALVASPVATFPAITCRSGYSFLIMRRQCKMCIRDSPDSCRSQA